MNRQRVFAIVSVAAAAYGVYKAVRRAESAAEEIADRRRLSGHVVVAAVLAVAAIALAFKKANDATTKVAEAF
jgi:hypothetical protein